MQDATRTSTAVDIDLPVRQGEFLTPHIHESDDNLELNVELERKKKELTVILGDSFGVVRDI